MLPAAIVQCSFHLDKVFPLCSVLTHKKCEEVKITQGINHRLSVFSLKEHILCSTTNRPFHYSTAARLIKEDKQELQAATCSVFILQSLFRYSLKPTNSEITFCFAWCNSPHPSNCFLPASLGHFHLVGKRLGCSLCIQKASYINTKGRPKGSCFK